MRDGTSRPSGALLSSARSPSVGTKALDNRAVRELPSPAGTIGVAGGQCVQSGHAVGIVFDLDQPLSGIGHGPAQIQALGSRSVRARTRLLAQNLGVALLAYWQAAAPLSCLSAPFGAPIRRISPPLTQETPPTFHSLCLTTPVSSRIEDRRADVADVRRDLHALVGRVARIKGALISLLAPTGRLPGGHRRVTNDR